MIWKTYKYIYYWLYTWNRGLWGENDVPQFNAAMGMSLSFLSLILSILSIIYIVSGFSIDISEVSKVTKATFLLMVLGAHCLAFMYDGRYKTIENEFKDESKKERKRKGRWVLLYTFGSMAFYIFLLFFGIWVKS